MTEAWKQWEGQTVKGVFDRYDIGPPLGGTDEGAVFQTGRGAQKNHKAAIKLIPADDSDAEQWLSRWKLVERLSHPYLLQIFDMGRCRLNDADLAFVVMEFADEDLSQVLPERPLTPAEALAMLRPTLDALLYLHRQGLVHGHIKPANIMAMGNQLKLASDGVFRAGEPDGRATTRSAYDPPEAADGAIGTAGDVWSLGMTLAEVLTQRLPAQDAGGSDPVVPPTLPAPFFDIVRQCLRRDPRLRCSVADLVTRLQPPAAAPSPQKQPGAAQRLVVVPLAAAALVVAALAGGWQWMQSHSGDRESVTAAVPEKKPEAPQMQSANTTVRDEKPAPAAGRPSPAHASAVIRPAVAQTSAQERTVAGDSRNGVVREVIPEASRKAMDTIHGTIVVKVRVHVDQAGNVADAEMESSGNSRYFPRLALEAARNWKFTPGEESARSWRLEFRFTSSEASASAKRIA
ncbi:MAG: TonB family protein [Acidobacteriia bacterium]|nr:TonB family protein [Terriglobia bacterium]